MKKLQSFYEKSSASGFFFLKNQGSIQFVCFGGRTIFHIYNISRIRATYYVLKA